MILPHHEWIFNKTTNMDYTLPYGTMSTEFIANDQGKATSIKLMPELEFTSEAAAKEFVNSPHRFHIAKEGVYESVKAQGVMRKNIIINSVTLKASSSRRLGQSRSLASHAAGVVIDAEILIDEASKIDATNLKADKVDTAAMKKAIVEEAQAAGLTQLTTASVSVNEESIKTSFKTTTIDEVPTPVTGAARPMAGTIFSAVIALAMALAGHQLLA